MKGANGPKSLSHTHTLKWRSIIIVLDNAMKFISLLNGICVVFVVY